MRVRLFPVGLVSRVVVAIVATLVFATGCGSSGAKKTISCIHDSDCSGNLTCTQGYCVGMCASSKDCAGARCVEATEGPTCQPTEKVTCHYNSDCTQPLVCSGDLQCRNQCQTVADCPMGQVCTTVSKLCADPAVDKNYDPTTMDFKNATAAFGAGIVAPDGGTDATADGASSDGKTGDGSTTDGTTKDGSVVDVPGQPEVGIASSCPGTPLTLFGKIATGDSNPNYNSGVGARLPNEMVMFYGFTGYDDLPDGGAEAGGDGPTMGPFVNRIDYQRFDLTGKAKGPAQRLAVVEGGDALTPVEMVVNDVAVAPTGEVALIYDAGTVNAGAIYLKLLTADTLAVSQTIQLQSLVGTRFGEQMHVQWEDGQFVASWVSYVAGTDTSYLNIAKFLKDGTPTGSSNSIPTNNNATVRNANYEQGSVAFVSNIFAISYEASSGDFPYLTFLGTDGNQIAQTLALPYSTAPTSQFTVVGATTKGFVAVYNGQIPSSDAGGPAATPFATLATFVSVPNADGGVVGGTVAMPGLAAYNQQNGARSSSDALGAGFALFSSDGKATFAYFMDDGTKHLGPSQIIQQMGASTPLDEIHLMNLDGSYAISLYSSTEHLTRMSVSGCPVTMN
jgi:hypothetical protein